MVEGHTAACHSRDKWHKRHIEWQEKQIEEYILYDLFRIKFKSMQNQHAVQGRVFLG